MEGIGVGRSLQQDVAYLDQPLVGGYVTACATSGVHVARRSLGSLGSLPGRCLQLGMCQEGMQRWLSFRCNGGEEILREALRSSKGRPCAA